MTNTIALRNLDGTNRRARPIPDVECRICGRMVKLLRQLQYEGKYTLACEACFQEHQRVTCLHCGDKVKTFEWVQLNHNTTAMMCSSCAAQWAAVAAFLEAWEAELPAMIATIEKQAVAALRARESVAAELARTFFNLQRLALPPGDAIAKNDPADSAYDWESDPQGIFVLDLSRYQKRDALVPYAELSDIERAMMRKQAAEALKAVAA